MKKLFTYLCLVASVALMASCGSDDRGQSSMPEYSGVTFTENGSVVDKYNVPVGKTITATLVTGRKASNVYRYDYTWTCAGVNNLTPTQATTLAADASNTFVAPEAGQYTLKINVKCYNGADGNPSQAKTVQLKDGTEVSYAPGVLYSNITVTKIFIVK